MNGKYAVMGRGGPAGRSGMFAYVGCYTTPQRQGHGEGIGVFRVDPLSAEWTRVQLVGGLVNPSFLGLDQTGRFLYSVHGDAEQLTAFRIDEVTGELELVNQVPIGGRNGVHLAVDPTNRFLVTANYGSGKAAVFPIQADGSLAPYSDLVPLPGIPGPNKLEQAFSHPHHIPFDRSGRFIIIPDKGLDKVFVYRLDGGTGRLAANDPPAVTARPGACPRHVVFSPDNRYAYVNNEVHSSITVYRFDDQCGRLEPLQEVPTVPADFGGDNKSAEIVVALDGRFVYCSNRGHDSIIIYGIDQATGLLTLVGWEPSRGKTPRFIALDPGGDILYAANQDSDSIVAFRADRQTGRLTSAGQVIETGSPSCIVFSGGQAALQPPPALHP
ncbi:MAG: lactonase family protein [Negativicutes bacterium]|nr:lactonase family protein [Negativicutes bacterium]